MIPGGPGRTAGLRCAGVVGPQPPVGRADGPGWQRAGLAAIAEMKFPAAAQRLEIGELGGVEQIRIRHESPGMIPTT